MRKIIILLIIVVIFPIFSLKISAEEKVDEFVSEFDKTLPEELSGITDDPARIIDTLGVEGILREALSVFLGNRSRIFSFFLTLLGVTALTSLASLCHQEMSKSVTAVVGILGSLWIFPGLNSLISEILSSLKRISDFFASLIPIAVSVTALGGGERTALVQGSGMYLTLSILSKVGGGIFSSVCSLGLATALLSPLGGEITGSLSSGLKTVFSRTLGIFTAIMTAAFSLQTLIASAADSATMRAARYMASGLIPIVGSTVAGALSTLTSGLSYAKGIIGGAAVAAIILLSLSPLVVILCYRLALSLSISLSDMLSSGASPIFTAYRSALDMTLALYALSVLIYLFEIIIFLKGGVSLI